MGIRLANFGFRDGKYRQEKWYYKIKLLANKGIGKYIYIYIKKMLRKTIKKLFLNTKIFPNCSHLVWHLEPIQIQTKNKIKVYGVTIIKRIKST